MTTKAFGAELKKPTADVFTEPLLQSFYVVGIQVLENNHEMGMKREVRRENMVW